MADLIWAEKAIASLENIYDYISKDSPAYARRQQVAVCHLYIMQRDLE